VNGIIAAPNSKLYPQPEGMHDMFTRLRWTQHLVQLEMEWNLPTQKLQIKCQYTSVWIAYRRHSYICIL